MGGGAELGNFPRFRGDVTAISARKLSPPAQEFWWDRERFFAVFTLLIVSSRESILTTWFRGRLGNLASVHEPRGNPGQVLQREVPVTVIRIARDG